MKPPKAVQDFVHRCPFEVSLVNGWKPRFSLSFGEVGADFQVFLG